jgi:Xaa-Pro aminopeptidase
MNRRLFFSLALLAGGLGAADPTVWKIAGPPPESTQPDRIGELIGRRQHLMERLGNQAIVILWAAEPRNYAGDVDWPYHQENDFFYLSGITQAGSALVLIPGAEKVRELLFLPPSNPAQENWTGHILTPEEGRRISGIGDIRNARTFPAFLATLIPPAHGLLGELAGDGEARGSAADAPAIPVDVGREFAGAIEAVAAKRAELYLLSGPAAEYRREKEFAGKLAAAFPGLTIKNPAQTLDRMRALKSPREIGLLRHAVEITAEAFQRAFAVSVPGTAEYAIQAQFEFTFLRRNGHWGYPCIVASGRNATTLHYESNQDTMKAGDLLLMDAAAEFEGYSADVTRTIPVSGRFSPQQAAIYRLVWEGQQAGIQAALAGKTNADLTAAASQVMAAGLVKLGLMTDADSKPQLAVWFNHGISHGIGLNVHDPGLPAFQPGMVITMEPGLYFRADTLDNLPQTAENEKFAAAVRPAFEKYRGIGVRIEDDVLITTGAAQVLTAGIPSKLEEVETAVARLRKALKSTPLP